MADLVIWFSGKNRRSHTHAGLWLVFALVFGLMFVGALLFQNPMTEAQKIFLQAGSYVVTALVGFAAGGYAYTARHQLPPKRRSAASSRDHSDESAPVESDVSRTNADRAA